jgi:hypothetical protein
MEGRMVLMPQVLRPTLMPQTDRARRAFVPMAGRVAARPYQSAPRSVRRPLPPRPGLLRTRRAVRQTREDALYASERRECVASCRGLAGALAINEGKSHDVALAHPELRRVTGDEIGLFGIDAHMQCGLFEFWVFDQGSLQHRARSNQKRKTKSGFSVTA